jgi:hypothetical protein
VSDENCLIEGNRGTQKSGNEDLHKISHFILSTRPITKSAALQVIIS